MQKRRWMLLAAMGCLFFIIAGCGQNKHKYTDGRDVYVKEADNKTKKESDQEKEQEGEKEEAKEQVLFVITGIDSDWGTISLQGCDNQKDKEYEYTGATYIKDKYGNSLTMEQLSAGEMVYASFKGSRVETLEVSKEVFSYEDVHNYDLDAGQKTIAVGSSIYYYEDDIQVFYKNSRISVGEIGTQDTICLKGMDKKIYAIQVTSGHGTVVLENTSLFEGGNITIGNVLSQEITPAMRLEVPEGTYLLSAAKDGYGGSCEITVEANREKTVNLEELKGEEPKYCTIAFRITPENGTVYLNGEMVDLSQTLQLKYGTYSLTAKGEGYADWRRKLVVNSEKANISIELLTEEEEEKAEEEAKEKTASEEKTAKEQEESVKKTIEQIRNGTLSTGSGSSSSGSTGSSSGTSSGSNSSGSTGSSSGTSSGSSATDAILNALLNSVSGTDSD